MSKLYDLAQAKAPTLNSAVKALGAGMVIALPFEGTYIFAASAQSANGIAELKNLKNEDADKSVQLLTLSLESIADLADTTSTTLPGLIAKNWPGPLAIRLAMNVTTPLDLAFKPRVKKVEVVTTKNDFTRKVLKKVGPLAIRRASFGGKLPSAEDLDLLVAAIQIYSSGTIRKAPEFTTVEVSKNKVTPIEVGSIPAKNIDAEKVEIEKIVRKNQRAIRGAVEEAKRIEEEQAHIRAEGAVKIAEIKAEIEAKVARFEALQSSTTLALREVERLNAEVSGDHAAITKAMAELTSTLAETLQRTDSLNAQESNFADELTAMSKEKLAEIELALSTIANAKELHQTLRETLKESEMGASKVTTVKGEIAELVAKLAEEREALFVAEEESNVARQAKLAAATKAYQGLFASGQSNLASLKQEIALLAEEIKVATAELSEKKSNLRAEVSLDIQSLHQARTTVESAATVELAKLLEITTTHSAKLERNFKRLDAEHQTVKDLIASEVAKLDAVRSRSENDLALFEGARREFRVAIEEILKVGKKDIKAQREKTAAELKVALDEFVVGADKYLHQSESEFAKFLNQVEATTADLLRESEQDLARSVESARDTISEALEKSDDRLAEFVTRAEARAEAAIVQLESQVSQSLASAESTLEDTVRRHSEEVKKFAQENDSLLHSLVEDAAAKVQTLIAESATAFEGATATAEEKAREIGDLQSGRIKALNAETNKAVKTLTAESGESIAALTDEFAKKIAALATETGATIAVLKTEAAEDVGLLSSQIFEKIASFTAQSQSKLSALTTDNESLLANLTDETAKFTSIAESTTKSVSELTAHAQDVVATIHSKIVELETSAESKAKDLLAESSRIASETRQYLSQSLESTTESLDQLVKNAEGQLASLHRQAEALNAEVRKSDDLLQVDTSEISTLKKTVAAEITRLESIIDKAQDLKSQEAADLSSIERALSQLEDRPSLDEDTVHTIVEREIAQASAVWERMLEELQLSPETLAALQGLNTISDLGTARRSRSVRRQGLRKSKVLTGTLAAGLVAAVGVALFFTGTFSSHSSASANANDLLYCYDTSAAALIGVQQSAGCATGQLSLGIGAIHYPTVRPTQLNTFVANRFYAAQQRAKAEGIDIAITSGWRSLALQEKLFQKAIVDHGTPALAEQWVLPPNVSAHPWGIAIDVNYPGDQNGDSWLERNGWRYGLCRVYTNEYWHFEPTVGPGESCPVKLKNATDALAVSD